MRLEDFESTLNRYGAERIPFLFVIDFEMKKPRVYRLADLAREPIHYNFNGVTNDPALGASVGTKSLSLQKNPISKEAYQLKFAKVLRSLLYGDTYLANLTIATEISGIESLASLYRSCSARYKLLMEDQFLVFSPETFVRIRGEMIYTYPMKGTIDAAVPNAREKVLNDVKEQAEHVTIVDLLRNDLSTVADQVKVSRFRYVEEIRTTTKTLLQVSSEISGRLPQDWHRSLGTILLKLLPAGSVSGAPKKKTLQIIHEAEGEERGYYTGVMGIFDGQTFDSGVMIRYIERRNGKWRYRSGGGITALSVMEEEYREAIDKVYVPIH